MLPGIHYALWIHILDTSHLVTDKLFQFSNLLSQYPSAYVQEIFILLSNGPKAQILMLTI